MTLNKLPTFSDSHNGRLYLYDKGLNKLVLTRHLQNSVYSEIQWSLTYIYFLEKSI
jgi:hypothetical protein